MCKRPEDSPELDEFVENDYRMVVKDYLGLQDNDRQGF